MTIAGATGDMTSANGLKVTGAVNNVANTVEIAGLDLSSAAADQTTGLSVVAGGSFEKQPVTAPPGATHININNFDKVLSHMNRLWFADKANLAVYYLPLQQKTGEVSELPLNAVFRRGGFVRALATWTFDGGMGLDDKLVVFSSNGEAAIYSGVDPDTDFNLVGVFRFDSPMTMHSGINYGGDLYAMGNTGLLPLTTLIRAEGEKLGKYDQNVQSLFKQLSAKYATRGGWQVILDHNTGLAICNQPLGATNKYRQLVRKMSGGVWAMWEGLPARSWQWINNGMVFGSDDGKLYGMSEDYLNDDGKPIVADVQWAWRQFGIPLKKKFNMMRTYMVTDGLVDPYMDIRVDYDQSKPANEPEPIIATSGAIWDVADWDTSDWAKGETAVMLWEGATGKGVVGAPRFRAAIVASRLSITGVDILFEAGGVI
jgi:hypothetical protein